MADKESPVILDLQAFLTGPNTPTEPKEQIGKHWHSILESILFAAPSPLTITDIHHIIEDLPKSTLHQLLLDLQLRWHDERRGIQLIEVATGWQFRTHPSTASYVQKMRLIKPKRLSKAAMEALAVIAYRQPVTRAEVEQIRGVDSSAVIYKLVQLNLVQVVGKKEEEPGKPELLGTTSEFLSHFNLRDLLDLPSLDQETSLGKDALSVSNITTVDEIDPLTALQVHINPEKPTLS